MSGSEAAYEQEETAPSAAESTVSSVGHALVLSLGRELFHPRSPGPCASQGQEQALPLRRLHTSPLFLAPVLLTKAMRRLGKMCQYSPLTSSHSTLQTPNAVLNTTSLHGQVLPVGTESSVRTRTQKLFSNISSTKMATWTVLNGTEDTQSYELRS